MEGQNAAKDRVNYMEYANIQELEKFLSFMILNFLIQRLLIRQKNHSILFLGQS